jgi:hypothetical protein
MDHRGDILRAEPHPTAPCPLPPEASSVLDWDQPSLDDYQVLDLVPANLSSNLETKEERNIRLRELQQYSVLWKEQGGTVRIVDVIVLKKRE